MSNKISRGDAKNACIAAYNNAMSNCKYGADLAVYMFFQGIIFARTDIIPKNFRRCNKRIMNEDFVPFELAVKLNEKGYPQDSIVRYDERGKLYIGDNDYPTCVAPTIPEVSKWFRKEKNIYVEVFLYNRTFSYFIKSLNKMYEDGLSHKCLNDDTTDAEYSTYEQAEIAGINYVVDKLI